MHLANIIEQLKNPAPNKAPKDKLIPPYIPAA